MGWTTRSIEASCTAPRTLYRGDPHGPIVVVRGEDHTTATGPDGRVLRVAATTWRGLPAAAEALRPGVDVTLDGRLVARVRQRHHGFLRRARTVEIEPVDAALLPAGSYVRVHGVDASAVLRTDDRWLVRHPRPTPLTQMRRVQRAPGVAPDAVLLFAAIQIGLHEALVL